ncbi:hypothetical protein GY45DRAFT_657848 [Cubamyces sp. BRFM 1775]|nr:hypothetical protein GY45DRAFT_657848 [Cubamyces sp. BRFM 1775]
MPHSAWLADRRRQSAGGFPNRTEPVGWRCLSVWAREGCGMRGEGRGTTTLSVHYSQTGRDETRRGRGARGYVRGRRGRRLAGGGVLPPSCRSWSRPGPTRVAKTEGRCLLPSAVGERRSISSQQSRRDTRIIMAPPTQSPRLWPIPRPTPNTIILRTHLQATHFLSKRRGRKQNKATSTTHGGETFEWRRYRSKHETDERRGRRGGKANCNIATGAPGEQQYSASTYGVQEK